MRYYTPNDEKSRERYQKLTQEQRRELDEYENFKDMQKRELAEDELDKAIYSYNQMNRRKKK